MTDAVITIELDVGVIPVIIALDVPVVAQIT